MYIVYETDNNLESLRTNYLVLTLDTVVIPNGDPITAYAVIDSESVPLQEVGQLAELRDMHEDLIQHYRNREWDKCEEKIASLISCFKGSLDSFYTELHNRIEQLRNATLADDWTGNIIQIAEFE